jgi:hypothetical protein
MDRCSRIGEAGLHVVKRQVGIRGEQFPEIWLRRQEPEDELNGHACPAHDRLADHDIRIDGDAIE